jgi:hypothetical protein
MTDAALSRGRLSNRTKLIVFVSPHRDRLPGLLVVFRVMCSSAGQLLIQGLAVGDAPSNELWPRRDGEVRVNVFGQGCPQVRMMPTQVVPRAVAMATYRGAQLDHFGAQLLSRHSV